MHIPSHPRSEDQGFNMTPMIDVVFLLIIFFLVSSHLARQESQLPLPLPAADAGREIVDDLTPRVTVNVLKHGELVMAGRSLQMADLRRRLQYEFEQQEGRLQVRIRSDRDVPYRHIEPIMLACARTGIWNVQFGVVQRKDAMP